MTVTQSKKSKAKGESYGFLLIIGGILVLLNVLGTLAFARFDITSKRLFSLSPRSGALASELKDNLEIVAYFTEDLPPPFNATQRYVRDILAEYKAASKGKIRVRFVNPDTDEKRGEADQDGVRKVSHQVIENDGVNVREGYRGVVFKYLGENKVIPVIEDTAGLEYKFTQIIKEFSGQKTAVGVLKDHESLTPSKGLSGLREAAPTYDLREVSATDPIPTDLKTLIIAAPQTTLSDAELQNINRFVMQGGGLAIFGGMIKVDPSGNDLAGTPVETGLNTLLEPWGVKIEKNLVADVQCGRAPLQTMLGIPMLVPYPPVPIAAFSEAQAKHPTLFRLDQAAFPFVSQLSVKKKDGVQSTLLANSTKDAWLLSGEPSIPLAPKQPNEWRPSGTQGPFTFAVALEGKLPSAFPSDVAGTSSTKVRALVVGSSGFLRDEFLPKPGPSGERDLGSALALALNMVDWLSQDADLIEVRAKNVEDPALEIPVAVKRAEEAVSTAVESQDRNKAEKALEERKEASADWDLRKDLYRWVNTLGGTLFLIIFGIIRWRSRRKEHVTLASL